ncbi:MAG: TIGR00282 family metallophosphoesterase [Candidatus Spechtbacterales bacterium]
MKILFFGDVFGKPGRDALRVITPRLVATHEPDFVIANVENIAHGTGITTATLAEIDELGLFHAYTAGNHLLSNQGVRAVVENGAIPLVRPINYPHGTPGVGHRVITSGAKRLLVINALGRVFMKEEGLDNPFTAVNALLEKYTMNAEEDEKELVDGIFVDFHAEATAEKRTFGFYLDGRVSAVIGTHTHVPTRDEQVLDGGTAYISDVGMVGPANSSLGLAKEPMVQEMITEAHQRRDVASTPLVEVGAVLIETTAGGSASSIVHIREFVDLDQPGE